ncbi:hypothetical protein HW555_001582 [Spodoptera exigua]|uniref:Uncharacterized protein n=1 Tax=Spodoptera exigua TaxID=7107 RepID=A0A835GNW9_SPOEX|nr:hypothetical protein HW555_001582 [Spodoptera exigua]
MPNIGNINFADWCLVCPIFGVPNGKCGSPVSAVMGCSKTGACSASVAAQPTARPADSWQAHRPIHQQSPHSCHESVTDETL